MVSMSSIGRKNWEVLWHHFSRVHPAEGTTQIRASCRKCGAVIDAKLPRMRDHYNQCFSLQQQEHAEATLNNNEDSSDGSTSKAPPAQSSDTQSLFIWQHYERVTLPGKLVSQAACRRCGLHMPTLMTSLKRHYRLCRAGDDGDDDEEDDASEEASDLPEPLELVAVDMDAAPQVEEGRRRVAAAAKGSPVRGSYRRGDRPSKHQKNIPENDGNAYDEGGGGANGDDCNGGGSEYSNDELQINKDHPCSDEFQSSPPAEVTPPDCIKKVFCDHCPWTGPAESDYVSHLSEHSEKEGKLFCPKCNFTTVIEASFLQHGYYHGKRKNFCQYCGHEAPSKRAYEEHLRTVHVDKSITCLECDVKLKNTTNWQMHVRLYHDSNGRRLKCQYCTFRTAIESQLIRHERSHTHKRSAKCTECPYAANTRHQLQVHMRSHREGPLRCSECSFTTLYKTSLESHSKVHTGERHSCLLCPFSSVYSNNLKQHMRTHDQGEEFACNLCSYTTTRKYSLQLHMDYHSGKPKHFCNLCDFKTVYDASFRRHMKSKHRVSGMSMIALIEKYSITDQASSPR